jgi:hypothetical protein
MTTDTAIHLIWIAGAIHAGIVLANTALPARLSVRENLKSLPVFLRQIFYVHWVYIVLMVGFFSALCFIFAHDLAGASAIGRFLSTFLCGLWLLRIFLQFFYYDSEVRRANRVLDCFYVLSLIALTGIFGFVAVHPVK